MPERELNLLERSIPLMREFPKGAPEFYTCPAPVRTNFAHQDGAVQSD